MKTLLSILFSFALLAGQAQDTTASFFLKAALVDEGLMLKEVFVPKKKTLPFLLGGVALVGTSFALDEQISASTYLWKSQSNFLEKSSPIITFAGDGVTMLSVVGLSYISGHLFKNEKLLQTSILSLESLANASLIIHTGKIITSRQRPYYEQSNSVWHWFPAYLNTFNGESESKYSSFPSGHSGAIWSVASVFALQYKETIWVPVLCYTIAAATSFSRIVENKHWTSDVMAGSLIGFGTSFFLVKKNQKKLFTSLPTRKNRKYRLNGYYQ